ncbi:hypothetical protein [Prevotella sp.]
MHPRTQLIEYESLSILMLEYLNGAASAMGGCVATARRHSLLSLPCLL